jgi:hypothetical protein
LSVAIAATSVRAQATTTHVTVLPSHLSIGDQQFDASLAGFRAYLETTKVSDTPLYAQLAPDLDRLESRAETARMVLVAGLVGGVASGIYAIAGRKSCPGPAVTDPDFQAKTAAWGACNDDNMRMTTTFAFIGLGSLIAGAVGAWAIGPGRADLLDLVNKHNRLHQEPLRIELGFNPSRGGFAYGGAAVVF